MGTLVERLGVWADRLDFEELTPRVVGYARRILLDSLACGFGGLEAEPTRIARAVALELGGAPQAMLLGGGGKTSAPLAAMVNGTAIRYLDFNDVYFGPAWTAHPSDNLAALLATAEYRDCSGRDLLAAMIVAYDVQVGFSDLPVERNLWHSGWHHTAACAYASAAGVGKLLGLTSDQIAHAIALSGARANTLSEIRHGDIPMDKGLSAPMVASSAITYALLARKGFTGCSTLLEGPYGFRFAVAGGVDMEALLPRAGEFRILKIGLKPYPVEGMTPAMVQAALELRKEYALDPGEVEAVRIITHREALTKPSWDSKKLAPATKETADHSFPYCVAVALVAGEVTPRQFTREWLSNPTVARLIASTTLEASAEMTAFYRQGTRPAAVEVVTPRGVFFREVVHPKGDPQSPMTDEDVAAKFFSLAEPHLPRGKAEEVVERTLSLEREGSISPLIRLLGE